MSIRNDRHIQQTALGGSSNIMRNYIEVLIRKYAGDKKFYEVADFPWAKEVETDYPLIRSELTNLLQHTEIPSWESLSNDPNVRIGDSWKTFVFCAYGKYFEQNCQTCPNTFLAIKKIKGLKTAWFSILAPQSKLPEHAGPYNGVLRYHLGLIIPSIDPTICGIEVGGEIRGWKEGESLIFDDSHLHSAWNHSNEKRVVLFVDFERPLPFLIAILNKVVIFVASYTSFMRKTRKNILKSQKL